MQSGGTRSNTCDMDWIEESYKEATRTFEASNQLTLEWFGEAKRRIGEIGSKIESNCKKLHGLKEQATSSVMEISGCKAGIEAHEDRITKLEERLQELQDPLRTQGQQAENLGAQQLLDGVAVREIKDRVEKLKVVAQTMTISVPYISQDQYLGHPEDSGFS